MAERQARTGSGARARRREPLRARPGPAGTQTVERPLLDLPHVVLPPPGNAGGKARSLATRALLSVTLLVGVLVLAVGIVVGAVALNIGLWNLGRVNFGLVILTFAVIAALGRALVAMVRRPPDPEDEVEIAEADEPELHAVIRELAEAAGTRPPDRVVAIAEVNAYVREFGPLLGLVRGRRTMAIGVPLLDVLDVSELKAVLAHELGHLSGGDTRLGPMTYRTEIALHRIVESLGGHWLSAVFVWYWKVQHRISAGVRRGQELTADRAAVGVAGRQAAADAFRDIDVAANGEALLRYGYLVPMIDTGHRPEDLTPALRQVLTDPKRLEQLTSEDDDDDHDPWASHPPTKVRIARVAELPDPPTPVTHDARAARCLVRDPARWERAADEAWLRAATGRAPLEPVPWSAWADVVIGPEQRERVATVERALARIGAAPGFDGVRAAFEAGRDKELVAALVEEGWRAAGPDQAATLLGAALIATAGCAAADAGDATWVTSWSEPLTMQDRNGASISVSAWADRALAGVWQPLVAASSGNGRRRPRRAAGR